MGISSIPHALIGAVLSGHPESVETALAAGAPVNLREENPKTSTFRLRALEVAIWQGEPEIEALLRERGARPDFGTAVFMDDLSAVVAALDAEPERINETFLRPTYSLLHVAADIGSAQLIEEFLRRGLDPNAVDADGHAPLRLAARCSPALDAIDALLKAGADIDHGSKTGITALTAATREAENVPTVEHLLARGANPNKATRDGVTPLMKAASNRLPDAIGMLLEAGADPTPTNKKGLTALDLATKRKAEDCVALLRASS